MKKLLILLLITQILGNHSQRLSSEKQCTDIGKSKYTLQCPYNLRAVVKHVISFKKSMLKKMDQILNETKNWRPYMIDGKMARDGQFPYQVSLREPFNREHFCGGAIISPKHVLTAAHCYCLKYSLRGPDDIMVSAGLINLARNDGVNYKVQRVVCHYAFNGYKAFHDIGLIIIRGTFQFNKKVQIIKMISDVGDGPIFAGLNVVVSGWGTKKVKSYNMSDELMYINTRTLDINLCRRMYIPYGFDSRVTDWNICTMNFQDNQRSCYGDSGGPVVYQGLLLGIVSWAKECGADVPIVHTSVPHHYEWIYSEIAKDIPLTPMTNRYRSRKPRQRNHSHMHMYY